MLIIYRKSDGLIASNSGTNSYLPDGPPFEAEVQNAINSYGGVAEDYGEYRLHDVNDAATVQSVMGAGSIELSFAEGQPAGVIIHARAQLTCPNIATVGVPVDLFVSAEGGDGIDAILYIDSVEQARGPMPATWQVVFESPGTYLVEVKAGRHGVVRQEVSAS